MRNLVLLTACAAVAVSACGDAGEPTPPGVAASSGAPGSEASDPWRLLADGDVEESEPRQVVVVDRDGLVAQWDDLGLPGRPPDVDFERSIVIVRSERFGSGCEPIFRRLSIREDRRTVEPQFVGFEPGHECAADERSYALAVEVRRETLEPAGYTLIGRGEPIPIP